MTLHSASGDLHLPCQLSLAARCVVWQVGEQMTSTNVIKNTDRVINISSGRGDTTTQLLQSFNTQQGGWTPAQSEHRTKLLLFHNHRHRLGIKGTALRRFFTHIIDHK